MNNIKYIVKFLAFTVTNFMVYSFLPLIIAVLFTLFLIYIFWYKNVKQKTELNNRFKNTFLSVLISIISFYNAEPFKEKVLNELSSLSQINDKIYNDTQEILYNKPLTEIINYEVLNIATGNESDKSFSIIKTALKNDNSIVKNYVESKIDATLLSNPNNKLNQLKGNILLISSDNSIEIKKLLPNLIRDLIIFSKNKNTELDLSKIKSELSKRNLFDKEIINNLNSKIVDVLKLKEFNNIGNYSSILSIVISLNNYNFTDLSRTNSEYFIAYLDKITELHRYTNYDYECLYELRAFSPHSFVASYIEFTNYVLNYTSGIQYHKTKIIQKFNDLIYVNCNCVLDDVLESMINSETIKFMESNSNLINAQSILKSSEMFKSIFEENKAIISCWSKYPSLLGVESCLTGEPIYMESLNKNTLTFNRECTIVKEAILSPSKGVIKLYNTHYIHNIITTLYTENGKFPTPEELTKNVFMENVLFKYIKLNDMECRIKYFNGDNVQNYKGTSNGFELIN
jgi:hypothetical protein